MVLTTFMCLMIPFQNHLVEEMDIMLGGTLHSDTQPYLAQICTDATWDRWFIAEDHMPEMVSYMTDLLSSTPKIYHVLDLFGGTRKVSTVFARCGYRPVAFDIKFGATCDLTSVGGFRNLVQMTAQKLPQHWFIYLGLLDHFDSTSRSSIFPTSPKHGYPMEIPLILMKIYRKT